MRIKIIIALCAVLGVAAIVVVVTISQPLLLESILEPSPTLLKKAAQPDELLRQYFACISNGQYEDMYKMLTELHQTAISKEDFIAKHKSVYGGIEAKNVEVTIIQVSDDAANGNSGESNTVRKIVDYTLRMDTLAGEITYTNQAVFIQNENKEYRMQWTTHTIFPNLNPDDKVRVKTLSATRGCIYDRNGEMLAGPGVASAIGFVPGKMCKEETMLPDIAKVAELLEMTPESVIKKLSASYVKDDTFVQLKIVSMEEYELKEELLTVKGIMISDTEVRYYPLGERRRI